MIPRSNSHHDRRRKPAGQGLVAGITSSWDWSADPPGSVEQRFSSAEAHSSKPNPQTPSPSQADPMEKPSSAESLQSLSMPSGQRKLLLCADTPVARLTIATTAAATATALLRCTYKGVHPEVVRAARTVLMPVRPPQLT